MFFYQVSLKTQETSQISIDFYHQNMENNEISPKFFQVFTMASPRIPGSAPRHDDRHGRHDLDARGEGASPLAEQLSQSSSDGSALVAGPGRGDV